MRLCKTREVSEIFFPCIKAFAGQILFIFRYYAYLFVIYVHQGKLDVLQNGKAVNYVIILKYKGNIFLAVLLPLGLKIMRGSS